jgi:ribonucleoside-diphosphate reductase alpha chain
MTEMKVRPSVVEGKTVLVKTGCGNLYVTVNKHDGEVFEVFASLGKAGGCASAQLETIGRLLSWGLRSGASIEEAILSLSGIHCHESSDDKTNTNRIRACADAISCAISKCINLEKEKTIEDKEYDRKQSVLVVRSMGCSE